MKIFKIISLLTILTIFLSLSMCRDKTKMIIEKEKVIYKDSLKQAIKKTENRLYGLRVQLREAESDSAGIELRDWIYDFERIDDELNKKLGEIDYVETDDWEKMKNDIDALFSELNKKAEQVEQKYL